MAKKKKDEHIVQKKDGWAVRAAGSERSTKIFSTRAEAIDFGKDLAKKHNVCMVVHDENGKFEEFDCKPISVLFACSVGMSWRMLGEQSLTVSQPACTF